MTDLVNPIYGAAGSTLIIDDVPSIGSGSGQYETFLAVHKNNVSTSRGFNIEGPQVLEEGNGIHTHFLSIGDLAITTIEGEDYYVFRLDVNEPNSDTAPVTLTDLQFYYGRKAEAGDFISDGNAGNFGALTSIAGFSGESLGLLDKSSGSGGDDYLIYVKAPAGAQDTDFLTVFSRFTGDDGGFEEFRALTAVDDGGEGDADLTVTKETVCIDDGEIGEIVTGGNLLVGSAVGWIYSVTNDGNADATNVDIIDDNGTPDLASDDFSPAKIGESANGNGDNVLDVDETWFFAATGTVITGKPYLNTAVVTANSNGLPLPEVPVTSNYFSIDPKLTIDKTTTGTDVFGDEHTGDGIDVEAGTAVTWNYTVTNTGDVDLTGVTVVDDNGTPGDDTDDVEHVIGDLAVGASVSFTLPGTALADDPEDPDDYLNTATVTADTITDDCENTRTPTADDASSYFGQTLGLDIEKDAYCPEDGDKLADLSNILVDEEIVWKVTITNTGNVGLDASLFTLVDAGLTFTDDSDGVLDPGETWTYTSNPVTVVEGENKNTASVVGAGDLSDEGTFDTDDAVVTGIVASLDVDKTTEGTDKNGVTADGDGINIEAGTLVTWHYTVTNDGTEDLTGVKLVDDNGTPLNAADDVTYNYTANGGVLAAGATWEFDATGLAKSGAYANKATASANTVEDDCGNTETPLADDSSNYIGQFSPGVSGLTIGYWYNHFTSPKKNQDPNSYADFYFRTPTAGEIAANPALSGSTKYLLIGDEDGDRTADAGENVIYIAQAAAQALLNSSQTANDTRQIFLSQAIATQLNIDYLKIKNGLGDNGHPGPNGLTTDASVWLQTGGGNVVGNDKVVDFVSSKLNNPVLTSNQAAWQADLNLLAEDYNNDNSGNLLAQYSPGATPDGPAYDMNGEGLKNALQAFNQGNLLVSIDGNSVTWAAAGGDGATVENDYNNFIALLDHEAHLGYASLLKGVDIFA